MRGGGAVPGGSTRPRPGSPRPRSDASRPAESSGRAHFFSCVLGIGAGDPLLGPLPAHAATAHRLADRLVTDSFGGDPLGEADLGDQVQGPDTGGLAERSRAPVQQRPDLLAADLIHLGMDRMRPAGTTGQARVEAILLEALQHIANRLVVAAEHPCDPRHPLLTSAGQQNLAAPHLERILGPQPDLKPAALLLRQFTHKYGRSHTSLAARSAPFPTIRRGSALARYAKLSVPENPAVGTYSKLPSGRRESLPCAGLVTRMA